MPILLKTQVDRTDKTPIPARRARVGGLCGFRSTAGRVPTGSLKIGRCASVRELWRKWQARSQHQMERATSPRTSKREKSRDFERCGEKAGQSRGVVRAPRRSHLPAVRAVSGICEGVVERAKIALVGSQFEKSPPFQGTRRGCTKKVHGKRKKQQVQRWVKQLRVYREKQRAGPNTCTLPSEKSMLYCTRDPARIRPTIICQKSCSSALQYRLSGIS